MQSIVGLDIGYGRVKAHSVNQSVDFATQYGVSPNLPRSISVDIPVLKNNGEYVLVGEVAESALGPRRVRPLGGISRHKDPHFMSFVELSIAALFSPGTYNISLGYGLPIRDMRSDESVVPLEIAKVLKGDLENPIFHVFETAKGAYRIRFTDVNFIPQPMGTVWNLILDPNGNTLLSQVEKFRNKRIMVIDIGSGTTDISTITDLTVTEDQSGTLEGGMNQIVEQVSNAFLKAGYPQLGRRELQNIILDKMPTFVDSATVEAQILAPIRQSMWRQIQSFIVERVGDIRLIDAIYVTGGGGAFMWEEIATYMSAGRTTLVDNPVQSNAEGFYKYVVWSSK